MPGKMMAANDEAFAIKATSLFDGERFLRDQCVIIRGEAVEQIVPAAQCPTDMAGITLEGGILAPGLIELQVNGGGGVMFNNAPCRETVEQIYAAHRAEGTTTLLPTLLSDTAEVQQAALAAVRAARAAGHAGIAGIHLEGPFFDLAKRGAHRADRIRPPQSQDIEWLCAIGDMAVIVTLAPEKVATPWIGQLSRAGITVCAGHTNATFRQMVEAAGAGLSGCTHLHNAMSPLTAREPGTVGAALDDDSLWLGIIADGQHVHPANIRLAYRAKPAGKLVLVSDAMASVGSRQKDFELYGERINLEDGRLVNAEGALAGSAISLMDAVRFTTREVGLPLTESLRMASLYPANVIGLDNTLGRIACGYRADLVFFDNDFRVRHTWLAGRHQVH
jgi:N-acetylglucosamine-6-phosphate deacetylase